MGQYFKNKKLRICYPTYKKSINKVSISDYMLKLLYMKPIKILLIILFFSHFVTQAQSVYTQVPDD